MRFVLLLLGAVVAGLAVATMLPPDVSAELGLGICAGAGLGAPLLVVLWAWVELKERPRLRGLAPWVAGLVLQAAVVAVPVLYGKRPDDVEAMVKAIARARIEPGTAGDVDATRPTDDDATQRPGDAHDSDATQPSDDARPPRGAERPSGDTAARAPWRPRWLVSIEQPGVDVVTSVHIDAVRRRVLAAGATQDPRSKNTTFVTARSIDDGRELWTHRFDTDESGTPYHLSVDEDGAVRVLVGLRGVLRLPDGSEIGRRVRVGSSWSMRITEGSVTATPVFSVRALRLPGGDLVRNGPTSLERVGPDGAVRWSLARGALGYELASIRDRIYAHTTGERLVIDAAGGNILDRGPWFASTEGRLEVALAQGPGDDLFARVTLPMSMDASARRPDGAPIDRTGFHEILVERVDARFVPRWTRRFGSASTARTFPRIRVPSAPVALPSGGVLVIGSFEIPVDLGGGVGDPPGGSDLFFVELDPDDGSNRRTQRLGGPGAEKVHAAAYDDGAILVGGDFRDEASFGDERVTAGGREGDTFERSEAFIALFER